WRAHVAGARVVVAPAARVRHLEALAVRRSVDDRRRLQTRHRIRAVLVTYSLPSLLLALPRLIVLHVLEAVYALLVGRRGQARDIASGWWWNIRRAGELRAARAQVRSFRHIRDRDVRALMTPGSARLRQFTRGQIGQGDDRLR